MDRLYFLWDYDLTADQVRSILRSGNETDRLWLTARILSSARYEDVWQYLTIKDIVDIYPKLRLRSQIKNAWSYALGVWGYDV